MLEQLIESKSNTKQNANRMGFLFTTFMLVAGLCFSAVLSSLFAMNLGMGNEEFDLSALVAPVIPVETKPEPVQKEENQTQENVTKATRQANMLRTDEIRQIPDTISVVPNTQKSRPKVPFEITDGIERDGSISDGSVNGTGNGSRIGESIKPKSSENEDDFPELKKPEEVKKPAILRTSKVINSKATYLPKPLYPAPAIAVRAGGEVNVEVTIDETGRVISAKAVSGHFLLRGSAENAARNAKFTPTYLGTQAVKVTGIIIYNFVRN